MALALWPLARPGRLWPDDACSASSGHSRCRGLTSGPVLDLGDLGEGELGRGITAEQGDEHLELLSLGVDLGDRGRKGLEGAIGDDDGLADLEGDLEDLTTSGDLGAGA